MGHAAGSKYFHRRSARPAEPPLILLRSIDSRTESRRTTDERSPTGPREKPSANIRIWIDGRTTASPVEIHGAWRCPGAFFLRCVNGARTSCSGQAMCPSHAIPFLRILPIW